LVRLDFSGFNSGWNDMPNVCGNEMLSVLIGVPQLSSPRRSAVQKMGWAEAIPAASTTVVGSLPID